jgi:glycosyltransferase involved in cell wall biosynthesis
MNQRVIKEEALDAYVPDLVSVVVVTYNQLQYVKETLDSVLNQGYSKLQIIVSDDGSTDGTAQLISAYAERYPDKIDAILSEGNTGIAANFNRALGKVRGEFIAWLGGDDIMLPDKISKQVALLRNRPDAVGCCHDAEIFESPSGKIIGVFSEQINGKKGFKEGGVELWFDASYLMLPSTVMVRSAAVPSHGFDERLRYLNDWLLDVEIFRKGKCAVLNEVLVRYRRHTKNVSGSNAARLLGNEEKMMALGIVDSRYPELHKYVKKRRKLFFLADAVAAFKMGDSARSKSCLYAAARQGAVLQSIVLYVTLILFGPYITEQMKLLRYQRSPLFIFLSKFL